jgi:hypothetical protein
MTDREQEDLRIKLKARVAVLTLMFEAIRLAGETGIPSGHLYAALMSKMDLDTYDSAIRTLKELKMITEVNYLLKAVPPSALDKAPPSC